jgi:hypothetical protein
MSNGTRFNENINKHAISHDPCLEQSYGEPIAQPRMTKGNLVAFGELAGTTAHATSLVGERDICFGDSINDNRRNQPKSH